MKRRLLCALLCVIAVFDHAALSAHAARYRDVIYKKENSQMKIALTFDDGPHRVYTPIILDILKKYGIHATFFVVGENVEFYPDVVKRAIAEGHEIGNHTYTHCHLSKTSPQKIIDEINRCERAVYELCEYHTKLFRPPEGVLPETIKEYAHNEDYSVILWSVDTRDWAHTKPTEIYKNIKENVSAGDIILMHDYVQKSITPDALERIIPFLLDQGYEFVTVSELLGCE